MVIVVMVVPPTAMIIIAMAIFMRAIVSTAFFDGTPGCHQQTGQAE